MIKPEISKVDTANMFDIILAFPEQIKDACSIGKTSPIYLNSLKSNDFLILGMGGSAIGGDLLKSYLYNVSRFTDLSISVNRNYRITGKINENTNIIASSYSGNTEETIEALNQTMKITKNIVCISAGGELMQIAEKEGLPLIKIPEGYMPRAALAYSFFTMLYLLIRSGVFDKGTSNKIENEIGQCINHLEEKSKIYSLFSLKVNPAYEIASKINGTIPVIYTSADVLDSVNFRWRAQIQENAKNLAFGHLLPECNHNEINSWDFPKNLSKQFSIICLADPSDHSRIIKRFDAMKELVGKDVKNFFILRSEAPDLLSRMFDLIYFGDWLSFHLALLNNVDPTPIPIISKLKNFMGK
jgi:glucose/mannose-6-phosphate isomerase